LAGQDGPRPPTQVCLIYGQRHTQRVHGPLRTCRQILDRRSRKPIDGIGARCVKSDNRGLVQRKDDVGATLDGRPRSGGRIGRLRLAHEASRRYNRRRLPPEKGRPRGRHYSCECSASRGPKQWMNICRPISRALISVSEKGRIDRFARRLEGVGIELIYTGGPPRERGRGPAQGPRPCPEPDTGIPGNDGRPGQEPCIPKSMGIAGGSPTPTGLPLVIGPRSQ